MARDSSLEGCRGCQKGGCKSLVSIKQIFTFFGSEFVVSDSYQGATLWASKKHEESPRCPLTALVTPSCTVCTVFQHAVTLPRDGPCI